MEKKELGVTNGPDTEDFDNVSVKIEAEFAKHFKLNFILSVETLAYNAISLNV